MPPEDGVGCDDGADLAEDHPAERLAPGGEPPALTVIQTQSPAAELLLQNSVLLAQILDHLLLLDVLHACDDHAEQLPRLKCSRHARRLP